MEYQGFIYFGGYIVKKIPQYPFLGQHIGINDETWVGAICSVNLSSHISLLVKLPSDVITFFIRCRVF